MNHIAIPFSKLPIFSQYIYSYLKESGEYDLTKEFIDKNFFVTGYCRCMDHSKSDLINNCSTIYIRSNTSLKKYKVDLPYCVKDHGAFDIFHTDDKEKPIEYEYLSAGIDCISIYDHEVKRAVDNAVNRKKIIKKRKKKFKTHVKKS